MRRVLIVLCAMLTASQVQAANVQEITTDKGIKAWLVQEHSLPLIAVKIAFTGAGTAYDPVGKEGRANRVAALLTEGAGEMDTRAFSEAVESHAIGLQMGAEEDRFHVSLESLSEHKDKAFELLGLALTSPRFDSESLQRAQNQALSIIKQQESRPGYQLQMAMARSAFGDHPYSRPPLGTMASASNMTRRDLTDYTGRYLTRGNLVIAIVGDLSVDEAKRLLDTHLGGLPERYDPEIKLDEVLLPASGKKVHVDFNVPQTMVAFVMQGIKRSDPDYMVAHVMNHILGGGGSLNARLGREIREKRGLSYSVFSALDPMDHAALLRGGFATRTEQAPEAIKTLKDTLIDFSTNGPTDAEFTDAKEFIKGSFVLSLDSNAEIASFLINMQLHHLGMDYLEKRNQLVEAVTHQQVAAMAKRLITPENLLIVSVGKEPK